MNTKTILQWNCQGIGNKKSELCDIIERKKPDIICIQETMLSKNTQFGIKNYTMIHKEGHLSHNWHGGAAIFIHETVPTKVIQLNTSLQATAAQVNIGFLITIVSLYNSRSHEINERLLSELKN